MPEQRATPDASRFTHDGPHPSPDARREAYGVGREASGSRLAWRSLAAVTNKEFIHIIRDPGTLFISLIIPVFLLLLFGYALSLDIRDVPFCLVDNDRTQQSREFIERFSASG